MKAINQRVEILDDLDGKAILKKLEAIGRVCYKSEDRIEEGTAERFLGGIIKRGHESVLEHVSFTVRFICDRGISHEIVRHRLASYSQESTRYCNYGSDKFCNETTVICPTELRGKVYEYNEWFSSCYFSEQSYFMLLERGVRPEIARNVLPTSLKTELVMSANIREWRHFLKLRTSKTAHPQLRELASDLLEQLKSKIPVLFDDIEY